MFITLEWTLGFCLIGGFLHVKAWQLIGILTLCPCIVIIGPKQDRSTVQMSCFHLSALILPILEAVDKDELLSLRVFIDKTIVEVFVNGKQCVALRVYPGRVDSVGVSLRAQGRDALLKSLDAWQMKSIYG